MAEGNNNNISNASDSLLKSNQEVSNSIEDVKETISLGNKTVEEALRDIGSAAKGLFGFAKDERRESKRDIKPVDEKDKAEKREQAKQDLKKGISNIGPVKTMLGFFDDIKSILGPIATLIGGLSLSAVGVGIAAVVGFVSAIKGAWDRLKPLLGDENATLFDKAVAVMVGAIEGLAQIPAKIADFAKNLMSGALKFLFGEDNKISKFLDSFSFSEVVKKAADWLQKTITTMGKKFGEMFSGMIDWVKDFIKLDKIKEAFNAIMSDPNGVIGGIGKMIGRAISDAWDWVKEKISKAYTWVTDKISEGWKKVTDTFDAIGTKIGSVAYDAVEWVKDKLASAYTWVTDKITEGWNKVTDTFDAIGTKIGSVAYDAVQWVKDKAIQAKDNLFATIEKFFKDPVGTMIDIITAPIDLLIDGVAWVMGKLGFDDLSESLKNFSYADAVKNVIMAPINLLKKGVSWVMEKLGFGEEGEGEGDISGAEAEDTNLTKTILDFVLAPVRLIGKALSYVLDMFSWEKLKENIGGVGSMLKAAGEWVGGLLGKAIDWFKSKLSFFGGGDKEMGLDEELEALESSAMARSSVRGEFSDQGAIKTSLTGNVTSFDAKKVAEMDSADLQRLKAASKGSNKELDKFIDDLLKEKEKPRNDLAKYLDENGAVKYEMLKDMTDHELKALGHYGEAQIGGPQKMAGSYNMDMSFQELARRETAAEEAKTLKAAMTAEAVAEVESKYATPSAVISGTDPQAVAQSDELRASQAVYDANKGPLRQGGDTNTSVNAPTTNNQTINNTYTQSNQPSTRDDTDQTFIFRATGTSR